MQFNINSYGIFIDNLQGYSNLGALFFYGWFHMDSPWSCYAVFTINFSVWWTVCENEEFHVIWLGYVLCL